MANSQDDSLSDSSIKRKITRATLGRNHRARVLPIPTLSSEGSSESEEAKKAACKTNNVPREEELLIKPTCDCRKCQYWSTSPSWCTPDSLQFETATNKSPKERKLPPFLTQGDKPRKYGKIYPFDFWRLTGIERRATPRILVHTEGCENPTPITALKDTSFHQNVKKALYRYDYNFTFPTQSFSWSAIYRQLNVFIVDGPQSGKTLSYLPAVCSFALDKNERFRELTTFNGPLIVILCPTSEQCEEVFSLIMEVIYKTTREKPKVSILTYPPVNVKNTDILVTLPGTLIECLKSRIFTLKRLCYLVLEETSTLLETHNEFIYNTFKVIDEVLLHRSCNHKVQLIAVSSRWSSEMEKLLKKLHSNSLVCIGNNLEAALYGNIQFDIKLLMSDRKSKHLLSLLKELHKVYKTVVVCNVEEISDLSKFLVKNGIKTVCISENSENTDVNLYEIEWRNSLCGEYSVLLCTDFILETSLTVVEAMWLVHYSFPPTWTMFIKRFRSLTNNLNSPLNTGEVIEKCKTFLLVDESSEEQMPKILHLLNRVEPNLPEIYQTYIKGFRQKNEHRKILEKVPLCETLKLFGKCRNTLCELRHTITSELDLKEPFRNGTVRFKILNSLDVTKYRIQILEHVDLHGKITTFDDQNCFEPLTYPDESVRNRTEEIVLGEYYALISYGVSRDTFELCKVVKYDEKCLEVCLVRCQDGVMEVKPEKLFQLPPSLIVMEMYVSNLIPPLKDETFSDYSLCMSRAKLSKFKYNKIIISGDIAAHMANTLWLNNIVQTVKVDGKDLIKFDLAKELKNMKAVTSSDVQVLLLRKLYAESGIELPCYNLEQPKKAVRQAKIEARRAFLDIDVHNEVILSTAYSPDEFYVRLYKFDDLLTSLEAEIQTSITTSSIPKTQVNPTIGKYYLAPYQENNYARVEVVKVENEECLCLSVDYGDEFRVKNHDLRILPSHFLTKLPFQAIRCRLYGVRAPKTQWNDEATDLLYRYVLEPDSDIFRSLYCKVCEQNKTIYSILLKDGFGEKKSLINQLLIEYGLAISGSDEEIKDFELPEKPIDDEYEDDDDDDDENDYFNEKMANELELENYDTYEGTEIEKIMHALRQWFPQAQLQEKEPLQPVNGTKEIENKPEVAAEAVRENEAVVEESGTLTPEIYWSQTDSTIRIRVALVDVKNYRVKVSCKRNFLFWAKLDEKEYEVKFLLYGKAEVKKHCAFGQEVIIFLNKLPTKEWLQLTATEKRYRHIHYEVLDCELKEIKKKILDLNVADEEEEYDEDGIMYQVNSDLDSDYDELHQSSSD